MQCSDHAQYAKNHDRFGRRVQPQGTRAFTVIRVGRLKPPGFDIAARVANYPNGLPGDVSLFLVGLN